MSFNKNKTNNEETLRRLNHMFGNVLHEDIIKSVALSSQWKLDTAVNILNELSSNVDNSIKSKSKNKFESKTVYKTPNKINTIGYANNGSDKDVDVLIENEGPNDFVKIITGKSIPFKPTMASMVKKPANTNNNGRARTPKPVPIQNKSKRELEYDRIRSHILTGAKVLVLMRGLPGSGKTHLAHDLVRTTTNEHPRRFIYSTDDLLCKNGTYEYNSIVLSDLHGQNQRRVYEAMRLGISPIIVDNTNTQIWEMKIYAEYAVEFGFAVEMLEPLTSWLFNPYELTRRNIHNVPRNKIDLMFERYEKYVTPYKLFSTYGLRYKPRNHPPQPRLFPPLNKHPMPTAFNIPAVIRKEHNETPLLIKSSEKGKRERGSRNNSDEGSIRKSRSMNSILTDDSDLLIDLNDSSGLVEECKEYVLIMPDKTFLNQKNHENDSINDLINFDKENKTDIDQSSNIMNDYPKINLSSWGLTDEMLISWEVVDKPSGLNFVPKPQRIDSPLDTPPSVKTDASTITSSYDFNLALKPELDNNNSAVRVIKTSDRNICENLINVPPKTHLKIATFDKSTMTGKENVLASLKRSHCSNDAQHFSDLLNLFPSMNPDDLKEIYDKCHGDINWTVDLLLDINKDKLTTSEMQVEPHERSEESCICASEYETQLYVEEEKHPVEELSVPEIKRTPIKSKINNSEEALLLKKQLEEQFKINDAFYSAHVLNLRKKRYGEFEPERVEIAVEANEEVLKSETDSESESGSEEELIEMNVGDCFVEELQKMFSGSGLGYPTGLKPVLQLPASLIGQLHAYWLESVYQQTKAQNAIMERMVREDEELARKLQEKEMNLRNKSGPVVPNLQEIMDMEIALEIYRSDQERCKDETVDDIATRMKRRKLYETFPMVQRNILDEILQAHGNSFQQTIEVLHDSFGTSQKDVNSIGVNRQKELIENAKQEYIQLETAKTPKEEKSSKTEEHEDECDLEESATYYREQASHHLKMRQNCFEKANEAVQKGLTQVAAYYSDIAKMHKQKYEEANNLAATSFLSAHSLKTQNSNILDLHCLYVKEAEQALAMFIDCQINKLQQQKKNKQCVFIITGRGSHSRAGVSIIKPAAKKRLKERKLDWVEMNPGLLKVTIRKHSILTNDIK